MGNGANANYVAVGKPKVAGAILRAPKGTPIPTDAESQLSAAFKPLGYISEDGVENEITRSSTEHTDWGGDVVMVTQDEYGEKIKTKLIEALNVDVLKTVFGNSNVEGTLETGIHIKKNSKELEESVYVVETIMRDGVFKRIVIPRGKVSEMEAITYKKNELLGYGITISALADPNDADGTPSHEYIIRKRSTDAELLSFSLEGVSGTIDEEDKTVTLTLPSGTSLTALKAVFELSVGATAKIGSTEQVSGVTENNFTTAKTYVITAEDGTTTASYTVTVNVAQA